MSGPDSRGFRRVVAFTALALAAVAVVLQPAVAPVSVRQTVSATALVLSGAFLAASCWRRLRRPAGRRHPWRLIMLAAIVATVGNAYATAVGSEPGESSAGSDLTIVVALLLCVAAVVVFPGVRRRGVERLVLVLDGLVIGGAVLVLAARLVYDDLLARAPVVRAADLLTLSIPVLDVVLIVAALLLLLRTRGSDRGALILVALGFVAYAVSDLRLAVLVSHDAFAFGSVVDLGWIAGYGLLALAAWYPSSADADAAGVVDDGPADVRDTALVYGGLAVAAAVQALAGPGRGIGPVDVALWSVVAVAAVARQVVVTHDNATLRRRLEARVQAQDSDLARLARETEILLASVADGIYGVDADGLVTFANPSAAAALGYRDGELLGRHAHDLFHAPADDGRPHPFSGCYLTEAVRSGVVTSAEEDLYVRADRTTFAVEITASPLLEGDSVRGAVVAFRDITQRREVDRLKNEFISVVSHELRTPLTSIRGSLGLLASGKLGDLSPRARSMANLALESSERLTRLINDILDLERIESGTRPMDLAPVDSFTLLSRAVAEMAGMAHDHDVRLDLGLYEGRVLADADRVLQTLTNLVNNAVKFSEAGQAVELSAVQEHDVVRFCVRDRGRGIPADRLDDVFDRFTQVDSSDARVLGGTGLGLSISRSIVERHGGRIWVESALGAGTSVYVTLPSAGRAQAAGAGGPEGAAGADLVATPPAGSAHVLLVEDDDDLSDVLTTMMTGHEVAVTRAASVSEARRAAEGSRFDLVVLDLGLPDGDGYELVSDLRTTPATAELDLIVYSADDVAPLDQRRLTLGRTLFVTKGRLDPAGVEEHALSLLQTRVPHPRRSTEEVHP